MGLLENFSVKGRVVFKDGREIVIDDISEYNDFYGILDRCGYSDDDVIECVAGDDKIDLRSVMNNINVVHCMSIENENLLEAYMGMCNKSIFISDLEKELCNAKDALVGEFRNIKAFAEHMVENKEIPISTLMCYVDYDMLARDLEDEYSESNGYVLKMSYLETLMLSCGCNILTL